MNSQTNIIHSLRPLEVQELKKTEPTPKVLQEQEISFNISQTLSERFRPLDKNVY